MRANLRYKVERILKTKLAKYCYTEVFFCDISHKRPQIKEGGGENTFFFFDKSRKSNFFAS